MNRELDSSHFITIPGEYTLNSEDLQFEITPVTDEWLSSPERSWEESDSILEGRVHDTQLEFQFEDAPTHIARRYGIERSVSNGTARFLAYVDLVDEYSLLTQEYDVAAEDARANFEKEKEEIKQNTKGQGKIKKRIHDLWVQKYSPEINRNVQNAEHSRIVKNLILRKSVIDTFSVTNNGNVENSPLITRGFRDMVLDLHEQFEDRQPNGEADKPENPIHRMVSELSSYLLNTKDPALIARYEYRHSKMLVEKEEDTKVLDASLNLALESESTTASSPLLTDLRKLGHAHFNFLKKRAVHLAGNSFQEEYSHLSLLHDIYSVALNRGNYSVVSNLSQIIDPYFTDIVQSSPVREEIKKMGTRWVEQAIPAYKDLSRVKITRPRETSPINLPESMINYLLSPEYRIADSLTTIAHLTQQDKLPLSIKKSEVVNRVGKLLPDATIKTLYNTNTLSANELLNLRDLVSFIPRENLLDSQAIDVDLMSMLLSLVPVAEEDEVIAASQSSPLVQVVSLTTRSEKSKYLQDMYKDFSSDQREVADLYMLRTYLSLFQKDMVMDPEQENHESDYLWHEILNNPIWFVSPRGDRFKSTNDHELEERGIDALTFNIDKEFPRNHKVRLQINGVSDPIELWLDTNRNVLDRDRRILAADPILKQRLNNLILKRLYSVTSGLLGQAQGELEHGEDTKILDYKRAHYRILPSTPERPITMESRGAQLHAREVKEDYNIDIFAEIRRRRAIGTLKPNEFLTFVREVSAGTLGRLILPNDLTFKPELIEIPPIVKDRSTELEG